MEYKMHTDPKDRLKNKQNKNHHQKSMSKAMVHNGYGYMKRRYGLLSNETDRIKSTLNKDID